MEILLYWRPITWGMWIGVRTYRAPFYTLCIRWLSRIYYEVLKDSWTVPLKIYNWEQIKFCFHWVREPAKINSTVKTFFLSLKKVFFSLIAGPLTPHPHTNMAWPFKKENLFCGSRKCAVQHPSWHNLCLSSRWKLQSFWPNHPFKLSYTKI